MRHFSPPPPPPSDAAAALEELNAYRVREKLQGELRQDRLELLNKIDAAVRSLNDKMGGVEKSLNDKMGGVEKSLNDKTGGVEKSLNDKMGGVEKSLNDKMGTNFQVMNVSLQAMHTKIDSTKIDISVRAAGYALFVSTVAVSALGLAFEKKVAVVDIKPAPT